MSQTDGKILRDKKWRGILVILAVLVVLVVMLHVGLFIFLNRNGKNILIQAVKNNFGVVSEVESVSFRFPFTVVVNNFKCGDLSFVKADVSLGVFNPFTHYINLHKVYVDRLRLGIKVEKDKIRIEPLLTEKLHPEQTEEKNTQALPIDKAEKIKKQNVSFRIGRFYLKNASVEVTDATKDVPIHFILRDVNLQVKRFVYPELEKFYATFNASLTKEGLLLDNLVAVHGWIDYAHRNMDVKFEVNKLAYSVIARYLPPFWYPENLGIKEGFFSLDASFKSVKNDLVVDGVLSLDQVDFNEIPEKKTNSDFLRTIIALLKGNSEKATLPIRLKAKMDSFKLDFSSLQSEFQNKVKLDVGTIIFKVLDKTANKTKEKPAEGTGTIEKITEEVTVPVKDAAPAANSSSEAVKQAENKIDNVTKPTEEKQATSATEAKTNNPVEEKARDQGSAVVQPQ